ncbi:hypothetical protein C8R46DRAFT_996814 [Mycena filopes]|nr:hypothetical protein C8R46DRAFT_996814 [Mycena filopes]
MAPTLNSPKFHIDIEDFNDDANLDALRAIHLKIRSFEAQLNAEKDAVPQIPHTPIKTFTTLGRGIHKVVATFGSLESLIAENDRRQELEFTRNSSTVVLPEEPEPTDDQDRAFNGYKLLLRFVPALRKAIVEVSDSELAEILAALRSGARNARSDDTKNMKSAIVPWLQKMFPDMEPLDPDSREERGIYNDDFGQLLCPTEYDFTDEMTRSSIREGNPEYLVTAGSWWNGLYANGNCDPDDPEKGLFRGHLLMLVWKFIFTSPISVKNLPDMSSSSAPATLPGVSGGRPRRTKSRPRRRSALRVALSDQHHWEDCDGAFDYRDFYNNVVDYFEFPPGPRAKLRVDQLLDSWNSCVFRHPTQWSLYTGGSMPQGSVEAMRAAAIARESASSE